VIEFEFEEITPFSFVEDSVIEWVNSSIENENKISGDICFIFCNDSYLLNVNQKYLDHDFFTDVITFDYSVSNIVSGDIFISVDRVEENSKQYRVSFDYEMRRIMVHGVLHLVGYTDKSEEDKIIMTSKEDEYLNLFE